jgi:hypothetical protein
VQRALHGTRGSRASVRRLPLIERRRLVSTLLDRVWQDEGRIVAVRPRKPFVRYVRRCRD